MTCLSESVLLAILERRLSLGDSPEIEEHLDRCEKCRALVAGLAFDVSTPSLSAKSQVLIPLYSAPPISEKERGSLAIGSILADRFVVLEIVGMGGMGVVYAAYDRQLDRKVALKTMRAGRADPARLIQEARNLAKLTHPNVVVVYDVVEALGEAFLAMEYVKGVSLRRFQQDKSVHPARILDVYLEAAKGLSAAHAAGLVHRDIKPDNILLGEDGRIRITDFGLAREEPINPSTTNLDKSTSTHATTLEGTAPYIAPERFAGSPADARSDQFAFCVSLYEALYGEHPFQFEKLSELPDAMRKGKLRNPSRNRRQDRRIDRGLRAVLLRGLSADPNARYASMDDLAAALRGVARRKRAVALVAWAAVALAVLGGALVALAPKPPPPPCTGAERLLTDVWDAPRKDAITRAILDSGLVYAQSTSENVRATLDRYVERWVNVHTQACQATRVHGEQSEEVLDLRMACLNHRLAGLRAMTDGLMHANKRVVEKAVEATQQLGAPELCDEAHVLSEKLPPPDAATEAQVKALREKLAGIETLYFLGQGTEALHEARAVAKEAEAVRYKPLHAEADFWLGRALLFGADPNEREATLMRALHAAEATGQASMAMSTWLELALVALWGTKRMPDATRALEHAEAYATGLGDEEFFARIYTVRTGILRAENRLPEGLRSAEQAVARCEPSARCSRTYLHRTLVQLAIMRGMNGQLESALQTFDKAEALGAQLLGKDHPFIVAVLNDRANLLMIKDRPKEAAETFQRAATLAERADMGTRFLCFVLVNLGEAQLKAAAPEDALRSVQRALSIKEQELGPEHPDLIDALGLEGDALAALGHSEKALAAYQRMLQIQAKSGDASALKAAQERAQKGLSMCGERCRDALGRLSKGGKP